MKNTVLLLALFSLLFFQACSEEKKPLNPNGDSELALLMREMYEDGERVKAQINGGQSVSIQVDFEKILTAKATDPAKMQGPDFPHFAEAYVAAMKALKEAPPAEVQERYGAVVASCMNCHEHSCPGPMVRIKKLVLPVSN